MLNKVTFIGFKGGDRPPLNPHLHVKICSIQ